MSKSPTGNGCAFVSMAAIQIPQQWSAEQALAVWEFLDEIACLVWDRYELQLVEMIQAELHQDDISQPDLFDPDDEIPF
jgi:hypothetical protein